VSCTLPSYLGRVGCPASAVGPVNLNHCSQATFVRRYEVFFAVPRCTAGVILNCTRSTAMRQKKSTWQGVLSPNKGRHSSWCSCMDGLSFCASRAFAISTLARRRSYRVRQEQRCDGCSSTVLVTILGPYVSYSELPPYCFNRG
jgi:hypothetical protein